MLNLPVYVINIQGVLDKFQYYFFIVKINSKFIIQFELYVPNVNSIYLF